MIKYGISMIFLGILGAALVIAGKYNIAVIPASVGAAIVAIEGLIEMYKLGGRK